MGEIIVITSGKGGVGKTTTTANIGTGLAKLGKRCLSLTRIGTSKSDVVMGLENRIVYNLVDVIEGNAGLNRRQSMTSGTRGCICSRPHRQRINQQSHRSR